MTERVEVWLKKGKSPCTFVRLCRAVKKGGAWAGVLASVLPYGPALCEHILRLGGLDPSRDPSKQPLSPQECESLIAGAGLWEAWLDGCEVTAPKGFIFTRSAGSIPAPPPPPLLHFSPPLSVPSFSLSSCVHACMRAPLTLQCITPRRCIP